MPIHLYHMPKYPDPGGKLLNRGQSKSKFNQKTGRLFTKLFEYIEDLGNDQLAAFDCDLKRSTTLASIPNIALKTKNYIPVQFYSI